MAGANEPVRHHQHQVPQCELLQGYTQGGCCSNSLRLEHRQTTKTEGPVDGTWSLSEEKKTGGELFYF